MNMKIDRLLFASASDPKPGAQDRVWSQLEARTYRRSLLSRWQFWLAGITVAALVSLGSVPTVQSDLLAEYYSLTTAPDTKLDQQLTALDTEFETDPLWQEINAL
jgi:hypothetical protein